MVKKSRHIIKHFFEKITVCKKGLIRSSGLIYIYNSLFETGFIELLKKNTKDARDISKIKYKLYEMIIAIILHILDGDKRFSQYKRNPNSYIFNRVFQSEKSPDESSFIKTIRHNPFLTKCLRKILIRHAMDEIISSCKKHKLKKITIDVDQTAREVHGCQENAARGYSANRKYAKLYQLRIFTVRELKIIIDLSLLPGSKHSSFNFDKEIKRLIKIFKNTGITVLFVGDSGFESGKVCQLINENKHSFIFAEKQRKDVRRRGKYSKNKKTNRAGTIIFKECQKKETNRYQGKFREIFVKVLSTDGQLWFDFASDQFTNVFVTNLKYTPENIYKLYKAHAVIETIIEELKNDFGAGLSHSKYFQVNATMSLCSALAYNIKNTVIDKYKIYIKENQKMKLSTLQSLWIHTPGILVKHGNRKILKIAHERFEIFYKLKIA